MEVLVEALDPARDRVCVDPAADRLGRGESVRLVRRVSAGVRPRSEMVLLADAEGGTLWDSGVSAKQAGSFGRGGERVILRETTDEGITWILEEVRPGERLVVVGAGHVGKAFVEVASELDFHVTVIDERPEFARADRFPRADRVVAGEPAAVLREIPDDGRGFYVLLGHGYPVDVAALRVLLERKTRYIGMIGSQRRVATVKRVLEGEGFSRDAMEGIHGPIGLGIGAETPAEIAVSIAAEIVAVLRSAPETIRPLSRPSHGIRGRGGR
jgi:xanthine/CO dehydrogenase XdhC/CoxF family maturation factor